MPSGSSKPCEDEWVIDRRPDVGICFLAVVDGATDESGVIFEDKTTGRLAAEAVAAAVAGFEPQTDAVTAVRDMTAAVARLRQRLGIPDDTTNPPTAAVAVYSVARRELWRVGDVHLAVRGASGDVLLDAPGDKAVDVATSHFRAAHNSILLAGGTDPAEIAATDPGRQLIMGMLVQQSLLANHPDQIPFSYGVIDGTPVPERFIEVHPVERGPVEVVMATDGYLSPTASLAEAEQELAESLARDPLRIGEQPSTKGLRPGANSFDDRTYLRFTPGTPWP